MRTDSKNSPGKPLLVKWMPAGIVSLVRLAIGSLGLLARTGPEMTEQNRCVAARFRIGTRAMVYRISFLGILISAFVSSGNAGAAETINVVTYHTHPPFIVAKNEGLTYDLAKLLSGRSEGRFVFQVVPASRPRLNKMLEQKKTFIVPWVNPLWFKDKAETKHVWTRHSLMFDNNAIVSRVDKPVVYEGPEAISGMIFGGLRGHLYAGIDDYIRETGKIRRVDTDNHISNIRKLLKGRVDVTLMPDTAARFFVRQDDMKDRLFISPKPHSRYYRRVIISGGRDDLEKFIKNIIGELTGDPEWNSIRERYK